VKYPRCHMRLRILRRRRLARSARTVVRRSGRAGAMDGFW
jgi:hypothetical protein